MQYLVTTRLLYVDNACSVFLLQVVNEAGAQVVTLCHHFHRITSTWHRQQHAVLRLRLSTQSATISISLVTTLSAVILLSTFTQNYKSTKGHQHKVLQQLLTTKNPLR